MVFDGYSEAKDGDGDQVAVVLVEVKKDKGRLTREEQLIRRAVEEGRVSWKTIFLKDEEPYSRESGGVDFLPGALGSDPENCSASMGFMFPGLPDALHH